MLLNFYSAPGLAWQAALKMTKVKLDLLTDADMLLMLEKGIRGGICHSIYRYTKVNDKYTKDHDKNIESSLYFEYYDVNNFCGWEILHMLSVNFEWIKDIS